MDASLTRALKLLHTDPWSWAHRLEQAGLSVSLIGQCTRAGLAELYDAYPWSWTNEQTGEAYGGQVKHARITKLGQDQITRSQVRIDANAKDFDECALTRALDETVEVLENLTGPVLVIAHSRPDGDALGSMEAMAGLLAHMGHDVVAYMPDVPDYLAFAAKLATADLTEAQIAHFPSIVTVDAASKDGRTPIPDDAYAGHIVVNIDHHATNTFDADHQLVITSASSACEVIHQLEDTYGQYWEDAADERAFREAVYLGLCTDTGNFAYSLTTPLTHEIAADCMRRGADTVAVRQQLGRHKLSETRFLAWAITLAEFLHDDAAGNPRLARVTLPEATDGQQPNMQPVLSMLRSCEGIEVAMSVTPQPDIPSLWRVSLRSGGLDVASIAERHHGGGHRAAAGCKAHSQAEIDTITAEVIAAIDAEEQP